MLLGCLWLDVLLIELFWVGDDCVDCVEVLICVIESVCVCVWVVYEFDDVGVC